jgi:hypothetical protein
MRIWLADYRGSLRRRSCGLGLGLCPEERCAARGDSCVVQGGAFLPDQSRGSALNELPFKVWAPTPVQPRLHHDARRSYLRYGLSTLAVYHTSGTGVERESQRKGRRLSDWSWWRRRRGCPRCQCAHGAGQLVRASTCAPGADNALSNFSAGFGDAVSLNATARFRDAFGYAQDVSGCSRAYAAGMISGIIVDAGLVGLAYAHSIGFMTRVAIHGTPSHVWASRTNVTHSVELVAKRSQGQRWSRSDSIVVEVTNASGSSNPSRARSTAG